MNIFLQIGYRTIHYFYINRNTIYWVYKKLKNNPNIKIDGKINLEEAREYLKLIKGWLLISQEDKRRPTLEEMTLVWESLTPNTHKTLIQYDQSKNSCAIYGATRAFMYNSGVILTRDEIEQFSDYCVANGYREEWKGMYFKDANQALKKWILQEKGIEIEIERIPYKWARYNILKDLWYGCSLGGWITKEKTLDIFDDGEVNGEYNWDEKKVFAHCWTEENIGQFTDNYPSKKKDKNRWINTMFNDFVINGYHFQWCYFPIVVWEKEKSDYEKYLERGIIEKPNPDRVMTERLYGTLREREISKGL